VLARKNIIGRMTHYAEWRKVRRRMKLSPLIATGVVVSTAMTDAVYVFFNAAVSERRRIRAASWSSIWYLLSAFAVISYTNNAIYVLFAATGSWIGAFFSVTWLNRGSGGAPPSKPGRATSDREPFSPSGPR
jgi:uncharacterized membrane protein YhaH (DUF805 family)